MVLVGALTCFASGCGTAYIGNYGFSVDAENRPASAAATPPLLVSAREASTYSTRYLAVVEVTFENRTAAWKQVDQVAVDFGSPAKDQSVTIVSGDAINAWERAIKIQQLSLRNDGGATAIEVLGLGVAVDAFGAWVGPQRGPAASIASAPAAAGPEPSAVPTAPSYPDQHLLTVPFPVPPGLFTKRWILLSTPDKPRGGCVDSMILSYQTSDHDTDRVLLPFKVFSTEWQPACGVGKKNAAPGNPGTISQTRAIDGPLENHRA
jgi:hypothetical protein